MSEKPISPLRQRMLEDMNVRRFSDPIRNASISGRQEARGLPRPLSRHRDGGRRCARSSCI